MRRLNSLYNYLSRINAFHILSKTISEKRKKKVKRNLEHIRSLVGLRYTQYPHGPKQFIGYVQLYEGNNTCLIYKDDLIDVYENPTSTFNQLRNNIFARLPMDLCPYCDLNVANQLEHYLDKSTYPEFSIYPLNLIPCCDYCNKKKGASQLDSNEENLFINFYFDKIPNSKWLYVDIKIPNQLDSPIISVYLSFSKCNISKHLEHSIRNHFLNLKLFDRYRKKIESIYPIHIEEIKEHLSRTLSHSDIKRVINSQYNAYKNIKGENDIETAFFYEIANNDCLLKRIFELLTVK